VRKALVYQQAVLAGTLDEPLEGRWRFTYAEGYSGAPVSLTMPVAQAIHEFDCFPPAFEGLLPEGIQLEAMLRRYKLDRTDLFGQLIVVGQDLVGSLTVTPAA
jgi:serine/threonine-protein kinase HipA